MNIRNALFDDISFRQIIDSLSYWDKEYLIWFIQELVDESFEDGFEEGVLSNG